MKIVRLGKEQHISDKILDYKNKLKIQKVVVLETVDTLDHIACFTAWIEQGGNIFILSPFNPKKYRDHLLNEIKKLDLENNAIFQTSGTTGNPKLVVNDRENFIATSDLATNFLDIDRQTVFLNLVPSFTSGFWHIVMPALIFNQSTIILGQKDTLIEDLDNDCTTTLMVPGLIQLIKYRNIDVDFSRYGRIGIGSSQVRQSHAEFMFGNGCNELVHLFGSTESGSPTLGHATKKLEQYSNYLRLNENTKLSDEGELLIKGQSLCRNYKNFDHEGEYYRTGDMWDRDGDMIVFKGRRNEIVKMNGYKTSLLHIESVIEENTTLGACMAIVRHSHGSDWIELRYTGNEPDKNRMKEVLKDLLPDCNIPRKYTRVEEIPVNALNKKIRL